MSKHCLNYYISFSLDTVNIFCEFFFIIAVFYYSSFLFISFFIIAVFHARSSGPWGTAACAASALIL